MPLPPELNPDLLVSSMVILNSLGTVFASVSVTWLIASRRWSLDAPVGFNLVEFGPRALEFDVEQPHRFENFAEGRRCLRPVRLAESEDAVVAQVPHDPRVCYSVIREVARLERGPCRAWNDLDELEELHLVDFIRQHLHNRRQLREKLRVRVHQAIAHRGPVVEPLVDAASPPFLPIVAGGHPGSKRRNPRPYRRPSPPALVVLGEPRLQAPLVCVGAGVADVLPLVSAKNSPRLIRPAASAVAASRPLARAIAVPRS